MLRTLTGIPGLDEITHGGLPQGRITLVLGDAGAGKTILALQTLVEGVARFGEAGVFVSFEEPADEIAENVAAFGWAVAPWTGGQDAAPGVIPILDASLSHDVLQAGEFDLSGLLAALDAAIVKTSAKRVVFDGLNVLLDLLDDPHHRRREIARIGDWTRNAGVTSILTAKQVDDGPAAYHEGYGFLRYVASAAISLKKNARGGSVERTARVLKMRGSAHSSSEHPLIIRRNGMVIGDVGSERLEYEARSEHVSSGVGALDAMLGGGFYKASSILISGAPGTAKSTLSGAFIDAACSRGERGLLISFDEAFSQIERNLASVNVRLQRHVESGLLATAGFRTGRLSAEEHFYQILDLIDAHKPDALVIDPISALDKVVGHELAGDLAERLIDEAKVRGITMIMTSLLESASGADERTRVAISSIADTWIQLSFTVLAGERNRAVTIIKSRGNAHSNQVRELVLSEAGPSLVDVYAQGGAVLMGSARLEKEQADRAEQAGKRREAELAEIEALEDRARLTARLREVEAELQALDRRTAANSAAEQTLEASAQNARRQLLERRRGTPRRPRDLPLV